MGLNSMGQLMMIIFIICQFNINIFICMLSISSSLKEKDIEINGVECWIQ